MRAAPPDCVNGISYSSYAATNGGQITGIAGFELKKLLLPSSALKRLL